MLDGIDLDIECAAQGTNPAYYTTFVQQLRALMSNSSSPDAATASLKTTSYLITAAPQCVFPDAYLGPDTEGLVLTESAMQIDYLWPQFYNNPSCQFNSTDAGAGFQQSFHNWSSWAASAAPAMEVLVGLPASPSAAGMGYMPPDVEDKQIKLIRTGNATNFDGVMLWSAAWESANAQAKQPYLPTVLGSLTGTADSSPVWCSLIAAPAPLRMLPAPKSCMLIHAYSGHCASNVQAVCPQSCTPLKWCTSVRQLASLEASMGFCIHPIASAVPLPKSSRMTNSLSAAADPLHSGAAAQHILKSAALLCMALMLLVCLL